MTFDLVPRDARRSSWSGCASTPAATPRSWPSTTPGRVVGFGSLSPYKERPAYSPTVEDSVYVHRDRRGSGIGRLLLAELVRLAQTYGYHSMSRASSAATTRRSACTRPHGFELVGVEREVGRKLGRWLDVVLMQKMLVDLRMLIARTGSSSTRTPLGMVGPGGFEPP